MNLSGAAANLWIGVGVAVLILGIGLAVSRLRRPVRRVAAAPAEFKPDLDPFVHGSATEKRQAQRRAGNPVRVLLTDAGGKRRPRDAWVANRSLGGLRLTVREAVAEGEVLLIRATEATTTAWIKIRVTNCVQGKGGWEIGCQFVSPPPSDVMWTFG